MAENSKIQWTDHTWNPWIGCTKVSPGCANCYAWYLMAVRYGRVKWGKGQLRARTSVANWKLPLRWNRRAAPRKDDAGVLRTPPRPRVFCASLADWLDEEVSLSMFADFLEVVHACQNLDWLLLTKRPQNWKARVASVVNLELSYREANEKNYALIQWLMNWLNGTAPANVWLGTTVEDQQRADERIPELLRIPARVRFLSCEPLLGSVDLDHWVFDREAVVERVAEKMLLNEEQADAITNHVGIHWVICGGESGKNAREFLLNWARSLRDQCAAAGVAFFMKQYGSNSAIDNRDMMPEQPDADPDDLAAFAASFVQRNHLKDSHGGDWSEWHDDLRVREFPQSVSS